MSHASLSDKALAVFAFALYHQLSSGEPVSGVVARDAAGHQADPQAVSELEAAGLARSETDRIVFTEAGLDVLSRLAEAMRGGAAQAK
jgi:hypothetical protein